MNVNRKNYSLYLAVYFITQLMYVYINTYLPIYYSYASAINITDLGLALFASYLFMFTKPILSIYFDRSTQINTNNGKNLNKKIYLIVGSLGAILSFVILLFSLESLIIFMIFLGLNLAFVSLMDVTIDKIILERSINETIKKNSAFYLQLGVIIGFIIPNVYYFFLMDDRTSITPWNWFFIAGIATLIIVFPSIFITNGGMVKKDVNDQDQLKVKINHKNVLLMSIFIFFTYGTYLYEWILEPWAVQKLGSDSLFALFMIIFILLDLISLLLAVKYANRFNKQKVLMMSAIFSGFLIAIAPFLGIYTFFILLIIVQLVSGFYLITLTSLMFDISHKKVLAFQLIASFAILAKVILAPIGVFLLAFIPGEMIIMIAGILQIISIIPLYFIK